MNDNNGFTLPNNVYNALKWVGLIVCPALATLVLTIGNAIGWADASTAAAIVTAIGVFIGALIGVSAINYGGEDAED